MCSKSDESVESLGIGGCLLLALLPLLVRCEDRLLLSLPSVPLEPEATARAFFSAALNLPALGRVPPGLGLDIVVLVTI